MNLVSTFQKQGLQFGNLSASFYLPGDLELKSGTGLLRGYRLITLRSTCVSIRLSADELAVSFDPPLLVKMNRFFVDDSYIDAIKCEFCVDSYSIMPTMTIPKMKNRFQKVTWGRLSVDVRGIDAWGPSFESSADVVANVTKSVREILNKTRLVRPGYKPGYDKEISTLPDEIKLAIGSGSVPCGRLNDPMSNLTGLSGGVSVTTASPISRSSGSYGIEIPAGSHLNLAADLLGTAADVRCGSVRVGSATISGDAIFIVKEGQRVIRINELKVDRGMNVTVTRYQAMRGSTPGVAEGLEKVGRFTLDLFAIHEGGLRVFGSNDRIDDSLQPEFMHGITRAMLESTFTEALQDLYKQNQRPLKLAFPSVNWSEFFGIKP